jgi:hypothetical protein
MKQILLLTFCFLSFTASALAQASVTSESFDIATFQPPKGWEKQPGEVSVRFSTEDKAGGTSCRIILFKSLPGPGNSKENFAAAWQTLVKEAGDVAAAPQMFPSSNPEDWAMEGGFAPFEKDGEKWVALLFTISGYGKMVNVLVLTNAKAYDADVTAFVESISLRKPEPN